VSLLDKVDLQLFLQLRHQLLKLLPTRVRLLKQKSKKKILVSKLT
jgi:hypothetical protein